MEVAGRMTTDAGMFGLWSPAVFADVIDYDTWESELLEDADIARHVIAGSFVPINIRSDGAFGIVARLGSAHAPAELTDRERRYAVVCSQPYLFVSNGEARISGIEHVTATDDAALRIAVPVGRWEVTVWLIAWNEEQGQVGETGRPAPSALPDFTLLINPANNRQGNYRTKIETFDR